MIGLSKRGCLEIPPVRYIYQDQATRAADVSDNSISLPGRALRISKITLSEDK